MIRYFPKNNRAINASFKEQLIHSISEMNEVTDAFLSGESSERIAEEILDTIHACEGLLDKLDVDVEKIRMFVLEKNEARGDYSYSPLTQLAE